MTEDVLARARAGDAEAFRRLVEPHRRELQTHCYRMLGSLQDAEDALQETLLAAWQGLGGFEARSSLRTWLYRVATSRCLNALRATSRRPQVAWPVPDVDPPEPTHLGEVPWLEPYPDALLPEARYEATEAISLAFVTALQLLPPRPRAVLILRDVLGFHAAEVAAMLDTTVDSVTSALKRARSTVRAGTRQPVPGPDGPAEHALLERMVRAYEAGDVDGLVALLTDDVVLTMPPVTLEYHGLEPVSRFFADVVFRPGRRDHRLVATRANGQPAFGIYIPDPASGVHRAAGLIVLTLSGPAISGIDRFDNTVLASFGLPRTLAD